MLKILSVAMLTLSLSGCATTDGKSVGSNTNKTEMQMMNHTDRKAGGCSGSMTPENGHHAMGTPTNAVAPNAYAEAMTKMHAAMQVEASGNADVDFMRGMIPHHQGAIDMANIALEKSSDPVIRKLATDIVAAQKTEIAIMQRWLAAQKEQPDGR